MRTYALMVANGARRWRIDGVGGRQHDLLFFALLIASLRQLDELLGLFVFLLSLARAAAGGHFDVCVGCGF